MKTFFRILFSPIEWGLALAACVVLGVMWLFLMAGEFIDWVYEEERK